MTDAPLGRDDCDFFPGLGDDDVWARAGSVENSTEDGCSDRALRQEHICLRGKTAESYEESCHEAYAKRVVSLWRTLEDRALNQTVYFGADFPRTAAKISRYGLLNCFCASA